MVTHRSYNHHARFISGARTRKRLPRGSHTVAHVVLVLSLEAVRATESKNHPLTCTGKIRYFILQEKRLSTSVLVDALKVLERLAIALQGLI